LAGRQEVRLICKNLLHQSAKPLNEVSLFVRVWWAGYQKKSWKMAVINYNYMLTI